MARNGGILGGRPGVGLRSWSVAPVARGPAAAASRPAGGAHGPGNCRGRGALELRRLRPVEVLLVAAEVGPRRPRPDIDRCLMSCETEVEVGRAVAPVADVRLI